jgi:hypothetical protein
MATDARVAGEASVNRKKLPGRDFVVQVIWSEQITCVLGVKA